MGEEKPSEPPGRTQRLQRAWRAVPAPVRKTFVLLVGVTLIVTGLLLIVLPGPFTIPLLIAGVAVLASEFAWAASMARHAQHHGGRLKDWFVVLWRRLWRR